MHVEIDIEEHYITATGDPCNVYFVDENSLVACFAKITQRITFTPPEVEPELPPINIRKNKIICAKGIHSR